MKYQSRKYQVDAVKKAWDSECQRVLVVSPGGSGKTVMIALLVVLAEALGLKVLIASHRVEIITQTAEVLEAFGITPAIFQGKGATKGEVTVASMLTILARDDIPDADILIVDECHRACAAGYRKVINHFLARPSARLFGFSATPYRMDGKGMKNIFDVMLEAAKPSELVRQGYILAPRIYMGDPSYLPDITLLKKKQKDWTVDDLASVVMEDGLIGDVVATAQKHLGSRKAVLFSVSIEHSQLLCARFKAVGIDAVHVDGYMSEVERHRIRTEFELGLHQVLCNCMLLTEGWDMPSCDCVIMARPTRSITLFLQQAARCMRVGGYEPPLLLDHTWNVLAFLLPYKDHTWTLEGRGLEEPKMGRERNLVCPECRLVSPPESTHCTDPCCGTPLLEGLDSPEDDAEPREYKPRVLVPWEQAHLKLVELNKEMLEKIYAFAEKNGLGRPWVEGEIRRYPDWYGI